MVHPGATAWGSQQLHVDRRALEAAGHARLAGPEEQDARTLVSCGCPMQGVDLRIVDPNACTECAEGSVGEVRAECTSLLQIIGIIVYLSLSKMRPLLICEDTPTPMQGWVHTLLPVCLPCIWPYALTPFGKQ